MLRFLMTYSTQAYLLFSGMAQLFQADTAVGRGSDMRLVGNHDEGLVAGTLQFAQDIEYLFTCGRVEITGRFIGKQHSWTVDESAGDSDALLFSTRKTSRRIFQALAKADPFEQFARALFEVEVELAAVGQ